MTQAAQSTDHEAALNWMNPDVKQAVDKRGDPRLPPSFTLPKSRIWAPQYVIQASPLTKLFMRELGTACIRKPELLTNNDPFQVVIKRPAGSIVMQHNKPQHVSTLIPQQNTREVAMDEVTPLVHWLTGGPDGGAEESDIYGVVAIEVETDVTADLVGMLTRGMSLKAIRERQDDIIKQIQAQIVKTREVADARVKRALKATYNNVIAQWQKIKEAGGGIYAPSVSEALSAHILHAEIEQHAETTQAAMNLMAKAMARPATGM